MAMNPVTTMEKQDEREGRLVFTVMNLAAWISLCVGLLLCVISINQFSDKNLSLMVGIGFLVGSVFIYTIGTAMHLVHKRKAEQ